MHPICVYCGSPWCTCFDTDEEYEEAAMKIIGVKLTVRAYDENGYQKDILIQSERQIHVHDSRLKGGTFGTIINPKELPEMVRFEVILENIYD